MLNQKERKLEDAAAILHRRFGAQALCKASNLTEGVIPPHLSTSFPSLDAITGCQGVPLDGITLFSGRATSGKLTVAYKTLMNAQRPASDPLAPDSKRSNGGDLVAIVDLNQSTDPDYLARAHVDLERLLIIRPQQGKEAVDLLLDLARTQDVRAILVDSLTDLLVMRDAGRRLQSALSQLRTLLRGANCALIFVDEASPPWQHWINTDHSAVVSQSAALHIETQRESWIIEHQEMVGYRSRARVLKSRWARGAPSAASIDIRFDKEGSNTISARETW